MRYPVVSMCIGAFWFIAGLYLGDSGLMRDGTMITILGLIAGELHDRK